MLKLKNLCKELPQGLDSQIEEQGVKLSGGEKQRLGIARALLSNKPIVILDEVSASLDNLTQRALMKQLLKHFPDKTLLIITHCFVGVEQVDQVIFVDKGQVIAAGKHEYLYQSCPDYMAFTTLASDALQWQISNKLSGGDQTTHSALTGGSRVV